MQYLEYRRQEIAALGGGEKSSTEDEYCKVCKKAKRDDCEKCDKKIQAVSN